MKKLPLSRFESLAQRLVEDSFKRLLGGRIEAAEVASRLAKALEDSQADGRSADHFVIRLHPKDHGLFVEENPNLAVELGEYLSQLAVKTGLRLAARPEVHLVADESVGRQQIRVEAGQAAATEELTTRVHRIVDPANEALASLKALDAFLIVEGRRHLALDRPVITLGRRTDNDIVLESPSVSRRHAQIRWRYGRFVLFDLGGRGRTSVNGEIVKEWVLQPGDVFLLSDVPIIYGEGSEDRQRRPATGEAGIDETMLRPKL